VKRWEDSNLEEEVRKSCGCGGKLQRMIEFERLSNWRCLSFGRFNPTDEFVVACKNVHCGKVYAYNPQTEALAQIGAGGYASSLAPEE